MNNAVISVEHLSKAYRLGQIGTGTLSHDLNVWWAKVRGKPNPMLKIGETDHGNRDGDTIWALNDVSFTVEKGEILGIIGRNGAGKSTLLKILGRVTAPTSGKIKVKGRVASLLEVGTGFHPELTGRENIFLNGAILGMSRKEIEHKFDEIVDFSGVEKFIDTPVKRYSSGMYVRLAFAVAAHLEPEILLVDEVLAVGDAEFQKKCLGKMGDVTLEGRTVLFVSHQMGSIKGLCPKSIWLNDGHIQDAGVSSEIIGAYLRGNSNIVRTERLWQAKDAPGDQSVHLLAVRLYQPSGILSNVMDITKPMEIEVEISIINKPMNINITLKVTTQDGTVVLETCDLYARNYQKRSTGRWKSVCCLPAHILITGTYYLSVYGDIPNIQMLFQEQNILSWRVEADDKTMSRYRLDQWKGIVGPGIANWRMDQCN